MAEASGSRAAWWTSVVPSSPAARPTSPRRRTGRSVRSVPPGAVEPVSGCPRPRARSRDNRPRPGGAVTPTGENPLYHPVGGVPPPGSPGGPDGVRAPRPRCPPAPFSVGSSAGCGRVPRQALRTWASRRDRSSSASTQHRAATTMTTMARIPARSRTPSQCPGRPPRRPGDPGSQGGLIPARSQHRHPQRHGPHHQRAA